MTNTQETMTEQRLRAINVQHAPHHEQMEAESEKQTWKPLQLFNSYRLCLSLALVILSISNLRPKPLGELDAALFLHVSIAYTLLSLVFAYLIHQRRPSFNIQVLIHVLSDIVAITILIS